LPVNQQSGKSKAEAGPQSGVVSLSKKKRENSGGSFSKETMHGSAVKQNNAD